MGGIQKKREGLKMRLVSGQDRVRPGLKSHSRKVVGPCGQFTLHPCPRELRSLMDLAV